MRNPFLYSKLTFTVEKPERAATRRGGSPLGLGLAASLVWITARAIFDSVLTSAR